MPAHSVHSDVAIVGAGLAGLACARVLNDAGVGCTILESGDIVGGRARSESIDGFTLDRGFQVFLTAYPEAPRFLDFDALDLRPFDAGAVVRVDGKFHTVVDPLRHPARGLASVLAPVGRLSDKLRLVQLRLRLEAQASAALLARPGKPTHEALTDLKFTDRIVDHFLRPFFGGVFCERELNTSSRVFDFTFKMFSQGSAAVPARGMGEIAKQMAGALTQTHVAVGARATGIEEGVVHVLGGQRMTARAVVVATDPNAAARLLPDVAVPRTKNWAGSTTLYFATSHPMVDRPILVLNGDGVGLVNSVADLARVSPAYAPPGRGLVSVSIVGIPAEDDAALTARVLKELSAWFGPGVSEWRHLKTYRIPHALPDQSPAGEAGILPSEPVRPGVWVCGDYCDTASINGALASGRRTAESVLKALNA